MDNTTKEVLNTVAYSSACENLGKRHCPIFPICFDDVPRLSISHKLTKSCFSCTNKYPVEAQQLTWISYVILFIAPLDVILIC